MLSFLRQPLPLLSCLHHVNNLSVWLLQMVALGQFHHNVVCCNIPCLKLVLTECCSHLWNWGSGKGVGAQRRLGAELHWYAAACQLSSCADTLFKHQHDLQFDLPPAGQGSQKQLHNTGRALKQWYMLNSDAGQRICWQRQWWHPPGELTAVEGGEEGAVGEGTSAMLASSSDCSASDSSDSSDSAALRRRGFLWLLPSLHKAPGHLTHQQQNRVSQKDSQDVLVSDGAQCLGCADMPAATVGVA